MNLRKLLLAGAALGGIVTAAWAGPQPGVNSPYNPVWDIPIDSIKWSYGLGFELSPSVAAQDIFQLCGDPLSQIVTRITRISLNARATTPNQVPVFIIKRSSPTLGGLYDVQTPFLSATTNGIAYDANIPLTSKSVAYAWTTTTNPLQPTYTVGLTNPGGIIAAGQIDLSSQTLPLTFDWGSRPTSAPILRNGQQCIAVNLSNSTNLGNLYDFQVEWTEE